MNFSKFQTELRPLLVFNTRDIHKIEIDFNSVNLNNWLNLDYIVKLTKGVYTFADTTIDKRLLYYAANKLIDPSYVSCETALSYYKLLDDEDSVVSVNPIKTYEYKSIEGKFKFHKSKPLLMKDYNLVMLNQHTFKIATPEKAIVDFFFFNPKYLMRKQIKDLAFERNGLREKVEADKINSISTDFKNELLERRIRNFINIFMR
ncbi:MAG: hypothetical protein IPN57_00180 [Ignavibacteria bacterium]|nr:hypothetical protein [Ignavibacteria bacterium]